MDITPAIPEGKLLVEGYGPQGYRIGGRLYSGGVLACDAQVWPLPSSLDALTIDSFAPLLALADRPRLILLGTGARQHFTSFDLRRALQAQGLTIESMASDAACRTFNVLTAEGREVAVALLPL